MIPKQPMNRNVSSRNPFRKDSSGRLDSQSIFNAEMQRLNGDVKRGINANCSGRNKRYYSKSKRIAPKKFNDVDIESDIQPIEKPVDDV